MLGELTNWMLLISEDRARLMRTEMELEKMLGFAGAAE